MGLLVEQPSTDPTIVRALALLGADAPTVPIVLLHVPARRGNPQRAVAATDGRSFIRVYDDSAAYKLAMKGDARALAGALAHEAYNVAHGPGEAPAYARQLAVLRAFGVRGRQLEDVERAARLVAR